MTRIIHIPLDLINSVAKDLFATGLGYDWTTANKLWETLEEKRQKFWKDRAYRFLSLEDD